ncbi:MAG TPA: hypothetical protein EYP46_01050 [Hadesarchaea archaeon]|nr:hypothetical protein [Hadesarchaea archaeon]
MEFPFRSAAVSVHAHATEDENRVLEALKAILPEGIEIRRSGLKGHYGNQITSFEARMSREPVLREFWRRIVAKLRTGGLEKLRERVLTGVDDSCHLYLRFDKQIACGGELVHTTSGDSIHVKFKVSVFPAKRGKAIELVEKFVKEGQKDEGKTKIYRF